MFQLGMCAGVLSRHEVPRALQLYVLELKADFENVARCAPPDNLQRSKAQRLNAAKACRLVHLAVLLRTPVCGTLSPPAHMLQCTQHRAPQRIQLLHRRALLRFAH